MVIRARTESRHHHRYQNFRFEVTNILLITMYLLTLFLGLVIAQLQLLVIFLKNH